MTDLAWATRIALTPLCLVRAEGPLTLAFSQHADCSALALSQYAVCAALAAVSSAAFENAQASAFLSAAPAILFAGLVSGGLGYTLQIVGQRCTPPAEAALILSLESVFAAVAGAVFLGERLTATAAAGCALILMGAVAAETAPALAGRKPA